MKEHLKKLGAALKTVYGWGIMLCLFGGGLTFFGYLAALVLGGEIAAAICAFVYKQFMPVLIYAASVLVLVGLLAMYLCGEVALSAKTEKKK